MFAAAMALAALQGWADTTLGNIADKAGLAPETLSGRFADKRALLDGFAQHIDERMAAGEPVEAEGSVRDRLFDSLMRRFDALAPYRQGVAAVLRELAWRPGVLACAGTGPFRRSLSAIARLAAAPDWGPLRGLQLKGIAIVYLLALRVFLTDDSADLAKTMAELDRRLGQVETLLRALPGVAGRRNPPRPGAPG